jgi:flagellar biosynthesis protein FlhF
MNIRQFFGKNSREALNMVRMALGENAVILSNRAVDGGNKIMAFKEEDLDAMVDNESYRRHTSGTEGIETSALLSVLNKKVEGFHSNQAEPFKAEFDEPVKVAKPSPTLQASPRPIEVAPTPAIGLTLGPSQQMAEMLSEMRNMRSVIESQLTTIAWGNIQQRDPIKSQVLNTLLSAGFSASLARLLAEKMPANLDIDKATAWIKNILAINLNTIETETEVLDQGGIFALIGPTGVGKTTTTAKLAARYVMKHGTQNIGLITTDAYRIGGHEQLRIYGKILGVMVHAVKDEADLKIALNELKNKHTILIDTVGVSQRDRMVAEQIAMLSNTTLSNTKAPIKKLLCLNATSTGETLTDVIRAYKGKGLDGCIITKLDEAATIGSALDVIIRGKLKLYYVANGQRVPEDIHMANKQYLIQQALKLSSTSNLPFQFMPDELPFIMGSNAQTSSRKPAHIDRD